MRAKQEYGRIVQGCKTLSEKHELWFITITCRGREESKKDAEANYGSRTNTLFTRWRAYANRHEQEWCYVQVTERQKRGHPHSHILTTWKPPEIFEGTKHSTKTDAQGRRFTTDVQTLLSTYVGKSCVDVGLGEQYDISKVSSVEGASRYVAKYLFKDSIFETTWEKGWKRVRYSNNFPKLPDLVTDAFVLMSREDWRKLARLAPIITSKEYVVGEIVKHHCPNSVVITK